MKKILSNSNSCTGVMLTLQSSPRIKRDSCDPLTVIHSCSSAGLLHRALAVFLLLSLLLAPFSSSAQVLTLNNGDNVTYNVDLNSITEIFVPNGTATISSVITGSANPLKKTGAGELVLAAANIYSSATWVVEGTLTLNVTGTIENSSEVGVFSSWYSSVGDEGAVFAILGNKKIRALRSYYDDSDDSNPWVDLGGHTLTIDYEGENNCSFLGDMTSGYIVKQGTSTLYLRCSGGVGYTISQGTLELRLPVTSTYGNYITNNGQLRISASYATFTGTISGTGEVITIGALFLSGDNTYTGSTTIRGKLNLGTFGKIENSSCVYIGEGCSFEIDGNKRIKSIDHQFETSTVDVKSYQLVVGTAGENDKESFCKGKIVGTGGIAKIGTGYFKMSGNLNSATGTFYCNEGTVEFDGKWAGNFEKKHGSTLKITGNPTIGGTLSMEGGTTDFDLSGTIPSKLSATGELSASGNNILNITGIGSAYSYPLITAASGVSTSPFTVSGIEGKLTATSSTLTFTPPFFPVTDITNVPTTIPSGVQFKLTGTVVPSNATHQDIKWSVVNAGTTGAIITGDDMFFATSSGEVMLVATIANGVAPGEPFTLGFNVTVAPFIPATNIINLPTSAPLGVPIELTATVVPNNASDQNIEWKIGYAGTTGATITGNKFLATAEGTAIVTATIKNGSAVGVPLTKETTIAVTPFVPVEDIINVPTTVSTGVPLALSATILPENASDKRIVWSVVFVGSTGAVINENVLTVTGVGTLVVRATIEHGNAIGDSFHKEFSMNAILGIASTELNNQIVVYPNPTSGKLTMDNGQLTIINLEIFDVLGKKLFEDKENLTVLRSYDLTVFPAGIYFLKITPDNGIVTKEVIKH